MKNSRRILLLALLAAAAVSAWAAGANEDGAGTAAAPNQYNDESDFRASPQSGGESVVITRYIGSKFAVSIPPRIQKLPVTSIGKDSFRNCTDVLSVIMPSGVTSIGSWAFYGCRNLNSVTMPGSVTSIGNNAFEGCRSLASIIIPGSVASIGDYTFEGCRSLASIIIGSGVKKIGEGAFSNCPLTSVTFQGDITSADFFDAFGGDLRGKYLSGGPGMYTRPTSSSYAWTKQ
ncbi:MAG: leucine-rich repeat domain-containing protein [Treponema sp.]|jgi:hypothetical protein|nr:leucine-rich repeat domain-containing protein [Treponema sp.]